tara:strand:+ start:3631 stop:4371 length:741 start_codon:yes stop_codon:yes gene_type:complete
MKKIILLRHGESLWNLENKFTGWKDVSLTKNGELEAIFSAEQLLKHKIKINQFYTSILKRAVDTSKIVAQKINFDKKNIIHDWRLNERHYGSLQGLNKSETAKKFGEDQVAIWRRSFSIAPPKLSLDDKRYLELVTTFESKVDFLPNGESLQNVIERIKPFWGKIVNEINQNETFLIVAHSNSIRAIIKLLEKLSDKEIISVNVPTGVPLVYDLDENMKILNKNYLINSEKLIEKVNVVKKQGKID